jgi:CheY-like chemotaxis protein
MTAENGLQAVQIVSSYPPDYFQAIILDLNMPIMDGYEACVLIDQSLH